MGPCSSKPKNQHKKVCKIVVDTSKSIDLSKYPDDVMIFQVTMQNFIAKFNGNVNFLSHVYNNLFRSLDTYILSSSFQV